jgi:hypothetical protein
VDGNDLRADEYAVTYPQLWIVLVMLLREVNPSKQDATACNFLCANHPNSGKSLH